MTDKQLKCPHLILDDDDYLCSNPEELTSSNCKDDKCPAKTQEPKVSECKHDWHTPDHSSISICRKCDIPRDSIPEITAEDFEKDTVQHWFEQCEIKDKEITQLKEKYTQHLRKWKPYFIEIATRFVNAIKGASPRYPIYFYMKALSDEFSNKIIEFGCIERKKVEEHRKVNINPETEKDNRGNIRIKGLYVGGIFYEGANELWWDDIRIFPPPLKKPNMIAELSDRINGELVRDNKLLLEENQFLRDALKIPANTVVLTTKHNKMLADYAISFETNLIIAHLKLDLGEALRRIDYEASINSAECVICLEEHKNIENCCTGCKIKFIRACLNCNEYNSNDEFCKHLNMDVEAFRVCSDWINIIPEEKTNTVPQFHINFKTGKVDVEHVNVEYNKEGKEIVRIPVFGAGVGKGSILPLDKGEPKSDKSPQETAEDTSPQIPEDAKMCRHCSGSYNIEPEPEETAKLDNQFILSKSKKTKRVYCTTHGGIRYYNDICSKFGCKKHKWTGRKGFAIWCPVCGAETDKIEVD